MYLKEEALSMKKETLMTYRNCLVTNVSVKHLQFPSSMPSDAIN